MTAFKNSLSFVLLFVVSMGYGQIGHYFVGAYAGSHGTAIGDVGNISWSLGEPIVFNMETSTGSTNFGIAQGMQSYPTSLIVLQCPIVTVNSSSSVLCGSLNSLELSYVISYPPDNLLAPDSIQWYFSSIPTNDTTQLSKIVGAQSSIFKPFFPGYYAVRLKFNKLACNRVFSSPLKVENYTSGVSAPNISSSGAPPNLLTATPDGQMGSPALQWYAYVGDPLNKYFLVAGATSNELKVRYDANYMVVATYLNGCRLSNVSTVSGHGRPLERASDIRLEGNSVFIPELAISSESSMKVYPNPANGYFYIQYQSPLEIVSKVELYSNAGVFLKEIEFTEGGSWAKSAKVNTEYLSAGVYFLKINEENKSLVQKVMIYK